MYNESMVESELNPEWEEAIKQGIKDALDNFELLEIVNVSPVTISGGIDERSFLELSLSEQEYVKHVLFREVGFDPQKTEVETTYAMEAPKGAAWSGISQVTIFRTASSGRNMFLHQINYPDNKTDYIVASKDFRL